MILQWKSFSIDLDSFNAFLKSDIPNADGIVAGEEHFEIIEKNTFEQSDINAVQAYYDGLTEEGEIAKKTPSIEDALKIRIAEAMQFGHSIIVEVAAENVMMSLTVPQIISVLTKCAGVKAMLESGSLYTAIAALNAMTPDDILTAERIQKYKNKIESYLEIPLT